MVRGTAAALAIPHFSDVHRAAAGAANAIRLHIAEFRKQFMALGGFILLGISVTEVGR
jgi:hypothetical protein